MLEPKPPPRRPKGGRWGLLVTALAASLALVLAGWSSHARVVEASRTLERGQGQALLTRAHARLAASDGEPTVAELQGLLTEERGAGLLYVGVVRMDGEVVVEAGEKLAPIDMSPGGDEVSLVEIGSAVRVVQRPDPHHPPGPPLDGPPPGGPPELPGGPPRAPPGGPPFGGPPFGGPPPGGPGPPGPPENGGGPHGRPPPLAALVVDFDPVVADGLRAGALRTFVASSAAAVALMAAAIVFSRQLRDRERAREKLERERRLAALGEMSAVLAHEIKNPLTALKGHAQLLVEQLEPGSREHKKAERIVGSAKRLEDLSVTLLDFIRSAELSKERVDPKALFARIAEEIAPDRVNTSFERCPSAFRLDPLRMEQVLSNLLKNALEASPPDAKIDLGAELESGLLVVTVRDRGEGIPKGEEETIFEPFHTTRVRGTGLGLAVSRRIVEMHGGTLSVSNHPDGGALFRASIPG